MTEGSITQKTTFSFWVLAALFGGVFALVGWAANEFGSLRSEHRQDLEKLTSNFHREFVRKDVHDLALAHISEKLDEVLTEVKK